MSDQNIQSQIDALNSKMDLLLEYVNEQRLKSKTVEDFISDVSIIGKDVYDSTVEELDRRQVEIDPAELTELGIIFARNIKTFITLMNTLESMMDLMKELSPIANEVIIDVSKKLGDLENKGYVEFFKEVFRIFDTIVSGFTLQDVKDLADNTVNILQTVKRLTQPDMMASIDNAVKIYSSIEIENIPEYSLWKTMKEMNSPEMKQSLGFIVTFMKNVAKTTNTLKQ